MTAISDFDDYCSKFQDHIEGYLMIVKRRRMNTLDSYRFAVWCFHGNSERIDTILSLEKHSKIDNYDIDSNPQTWADALLYLYKFNHLEPPRTAQND
jgi:hypothetical protein